MEKIHIWPEATTEQGGFVTAGFTLEEVNHERKSVWYRTPAEFSSYITNRSDPFVLAAIFKAMSTPADLVVHGEVSPSLLDNLDEFQAAWTSWRPTIYSTIDIIPEIVRERIPPDTLNASMCFSGGVDSCFTARRIRMKAYRFPYTLQAGIFVHGLEIPLKYEATFHDAAVKARTMLESLGMKLIPLVTNQRIIHLGLNGTQAAFLVSCLTLLQEQSNAGLIASSYCYARITVPYDTNPVTDRMLGSKTFPIIHDGAEYTRLQKTNELANWPEALQNVRVCLGKDAKKRSQNCCRCEKCTRTILGFRAMGHGLPPAFEKDVTIWDILKLKYSIVMKTAHIFEDILDATQERRVSAPWVLALKISVFLNNIRIKAEQIPWINWILIKIKQVIRTICH